MWETWKQAKTFSKLPSEVFDPTGEVWENDGIHGPLARWMFNAVVTWFGITIENLLSERVEVNVGKKLQSNPKYTLTRLLHEDFRVIRTPEPEDRYGGTGNIWAPFLVWADKPGGLIKRWVYKAPDGEERKTVD